jgi:predicted phosphate transport protein (TIGR00153 family)
VITAPGALHRQPGIRRLEPRLPLDSGPDPAKIGRESGGTPNRSPQIERGPPMKFLPSQVDFLAFFERSADNVLEGAKAFNVMVADYRDLDAKVARIKELETKGDHITHETLQALNKTFITPIDREDIHQLSSKLDDILDLIDAAAHRLVGYRIAEATPDLVLHAEMLIKPIETIKTALLLLDNMRHQERIIDLCRQVRQLEHDADVIHHTAITRLFDEEKDPIRIMKLKEIYENLEEATDRCEDVADVIESVILKNS